MQAAVANNSITRTLALALRSIGNLERLAEYLGVPTTDLEEWLDGRREPPTSIYVRALDLVARGPFTAPHRGAERGKKKH
jgi:DNA-binding transcriptional regulator YiaG